MKKIVITGGSGFIGSNLADQLLKKGYFVHVYDNLSTGREKFLEDASLNANFQFTIGDIADQEKLFSVMSGVDCVFHLAANADVRYGLEDPGRDLRENTIGTFNVLEAMRKANVKKIAFSSTSSIYGEAPIIPTPENCPFPIQTSLYGASKLAGESLIQAYCTGYQFQAWIFRFVSILGPRYTHGHVYDFIRKLLINPNQIEVLGDGNQRKGYLHINDCVSGIIHVLENANDNINIFNLGRNETCTVKESLGYICKKMGLSPEFMYTGGKGGWIGDNPVIQLSPDKIESLGWKSKYSIKDSIESTVDWIMANQWVYKSK